MLTRLLKVNGENHLQERFYPILLKNAGSQKVAQGVVLLIQLAIYDYLQGLPPMMEPIMQMMVPDLIKALIDDEGVASEAQRFYEETQAFSQK